MESYSTWLDGEERHVPGCRGTVRLEDGIEYCQGLDMSLRTQRNTGGCMDLRPSAHDMRNKQTDM